MKNRTPHSRRFWTVGSAIVLFSAVFAQSSLAQPSLDFRRIVLHWPEVELQFTPMCGTQPTFGITPQDIRIEENGENITSFTMWCPDPAQTYPFSVALVFDASGSMAGAGNAAAKQGGHAFVDLMDTADEAAVLCFNQVAVLLQQTTSSRTQIDAAIDAIPAIGGTALWDGGYNGVVEILNNGIRPLRAMVLLTDGADNSSVRTPAELIALATRYGVRIYTIGYGSGINAVELQAVAQQTGGRYYQTNNAAALTTIYQEIAALIHLSFGECRIRYNRTCADGTMRIVALHLLNFCNGSPSASRSYQAPLDSATFVAFHIDPVGCEAGTATDARVPILLASPVAPPRYVGPFSFIAEWNPALLSFAGVEVPPGSLFDGVPLAVQPLPGGRLQITAGPPAVLSAAGVLLNLVFSTASVSTRTTAAVTLRDATFPTGCMSMQADTCAVTILPPDANDVAQLQFTDISHENDSTHLHFRAWCNQSRVMTLTPFDIRVWSAGAEIHSFALSCPDSLSDCLVSYIEPCRDGRTKVIDLRVAGICGDTLTRTRSHTAPRDPHPITVIGATHLCPGDSTVLEAETGFNSYRWSTGETTRRITVRTPGVYAAALGDTLSGCMITSDWVDVTVSEKPAIQPSGIIPLCAGQQVTLDAGAGYSAYRWSNGAQTRTITVTKPGGYAVTADDGSGCTLVSDSVWVVLTTTIVPGIVPSGPTTFCSGGSVRLMADSGYVSYLWSDGSVTQSIVVSSSGTYSVSVMSASGCTGASQPVTVTVSPNPAPVISVTGRLDVCAGDSVELDAGVGYAAYLWSTGETTRLIRAKTAGNYSVTVTNAAGCSGTAAAVTVIVYLAPPKPAITRNGDLLTTDLASAYQWYRNGQPLSGQVNQYLIATQSGVYQVRVTNASGCSTMSDPLPVTTTAVDERSPVAFDVYPDPNTGSVTIDLRDVALRSVRLTVTDMLGREVFRLEDQPRTGAVWHRTVDLTGLQAGAYFLRITSGDRQWTRRIVRR
jgi:hypothetical protein